MEITLLGIVVTVITTLASAFLGRIALRTLRLLRYQTAQTEATVLPQDAPLPAHLNTVHNTMTALGFRVFRQSLIGIESAAAAHTIILYQHETLPILASVLPYSQAEKYTVAFITIMADGMLAETHFQNVLHADTPTLHIRYASHSLEAAYQYHAAHISQMANLHHGSIPPDDPDDYLRRAETIKREDGTLDARNRKLIFASLAAFGGGAVALFLIGWSPIITSLLVQQGMENETAYNLTLFPMQLAVGVTVTGLILSSSTLKTMSPVDAPQN